MLIDLAKLKAAIADKWKEFAADPDEAIKKLGLASAYGLLISASFMPLAHAYAMDPTSTTLALTSIVSGVGINLLSNFIQKVFDKKLSPPELEKAAREDPEIQQVLDALITQTESIQSAQASLGGKWNSFSTKLESELQGLSNSPASLAILTGQVTNSAQVIAPVSISLENGSNLTIQGNLLIQNSSQSFPVTPRGEALKEKKKGTRSEPNRKQIYRLNLDDERQASIALDEWRFVRTFTTEPFGALSNGVLGIGQPDGTTFNRAPILPIANCSVECDMRIIDDGGDPSRWAGIRVRGFWDDIQFGYLIYLRREGTVELYRAREVIGGMNQRTILDTKDEWTSLRVDILTDSIKVWVNGNLHIDAKDKTFGNKGHIYLHTYGIHAQFRNFGVYSLKK